MGGAMRSLSRKMLIQFVACTAALLLLATPLFYCLTKWFYAEDMIDLIEAVRMGRPIPSLDLEEDIVEGMTIHMAFIMLLLLVAIAVTLRFIARRLWGPFDETLRRVEAFRLEEGRVPELPRTDVKEFDRLNRVLRELMGNSVASYRSQREFTENASHELQTPLAVFQTRLDLLLQEPGLTQRQADLIQGLYDASARLARLNRNLLLLAKIDNRQFEQAEDIPLAGFLRGQMAFLGSAAGDIRIRQAFDGSPLVVRANRALLECLVNNLVVNAARHNRPGGTISIEVADGGLTVSNTSDEPALDERQIFNRFYRPRGGGGGNGLGLSIVKAICDYHGWRVAYRYDRPTHSFTVTF